MSVSAIEYFSPIEIEPFSDFCFFHQQHKHSHRLLLCYATARDFLSVPKTFTLIAFETDAGYPPEYHCLERNEYLDELGLSELTEASGWFKLESQQDDHIFLMLTQETVLEIACDNFKVLPDTYHCDNAQQSLIQYLSD